MYLDIYQNSHTESRFREFGYSIYSNIWVYVQFYLNVIILYTLFTILLD